MFIAYKLVQWLLLPEIWIVATLVAAWALGRSEKRTALARRVLLGAIVALVVLATRPAGELLIRPLESTYAPVDVRALTASAPGQKAIVVLGGGAVRAQVSTSDRRGLTPSAEGVRSAHQGRSR